jgi:hypothetical protein
MFNHAPAAAGSQMNYDGSVRKSSRISGVQRTLIGCGDHALCMIASRISNSDDITNSRRWMLVAGLYWAVDEVFVLVGARAEDCR